MYTKQSVFIDIAPIWPDQMIKLYLFHFVKIALKSTLFTAIISLYYFNNYVLRRWIMSFGSLGYISKNALESRKRKLLTFVS